MSLPKPPVALKNPCAVVYDNTLYVYTAKGFQSLSLSKGAKWKKLPQGVGVDGAECVQDESQAAMYTVGGSASSGGSSFSGLQRFSFKQRKWETLSLEAKILRGRRDHGAAFLKSSSSIFVYGGSEDGADHGLSSETFLISTTAPYGITSFSSKAPPVASPLLLPWNDTHAAMAGGDTTNKKIFLFSQDNGFSDLGMDLDNGLADKSKMQATIIDGDDGSKSLQMFDMSKSPNAVTRVLLMNGDGRVAKSGSPAQKVKKSSTRRSTTISKRHATLPPPAKRRRRDLTASNWPKYNSSLAPTTTRSGFALAQGSNDQVVVAGGNDDDPLCMFDGRKNTWMDPSKVLDTKDSASTTSSSPSSALPSVGPTTSPAAHVPTSSNPSVRSRSLTILGATLGAIFGLAIILIVILLYLRWRRRRRQFDEAGHQRRASGHPDDKDRLSFADRGMSFVSDTPPFANDQPRDSMRSTSSAAIMSGRANRGFLGRGANNTKGKSPLAEAISLDTSPADHVSFATVPPPPEANLRPREPSQPQTQQQSKQRSSGWSRYFSGNSATNLVHMNSSRSAATAHSHSSQDSTTPIADSMMRERERERSQHTSTQESEGERDSATVAPLRLVGGPGMHTSTVASGSPSISHASGRGMVVGDGMSGRIERQVSDSTRASSVSSATSSQRDAFSSGVPDSLHDDLTWSPMGGGGNEWYNGSRDRVTSSIYTDSARGSAAVPNPPFLVTPGGAARDSAATLFPRPPQGPPVVQGRGGPSGPGAQNMNGRSYYDDGRPGAGGDGAGGAGSDMSWLNLGNTRE